MDKEDVRKQPCEVPQERRKQVVRMHRKGVGVMRIVEQTGLSWSAVNVAAGALPFRRCGGVKARCAWQEKPGSERSLSVAQKQAIQRMICDRRAPDSWRKLRSALIMDCSTSASSCAIYPSG